MSTMLFWLENPTMMLDPPVSKRARVGGIDSLRGTETLTPGPTTLEGVQNYIHWNFEICYPDTTVGMATHNDSRFHVVRKTI